MTTPRGYTLYSQTDNADIAFKLNNLATQVDTDMTASTATKWLQYTQTVTNNISPPGDFKLLVSFVADFNNLGWTYSNGVWTVPTAGDGYFEMSAHVSLVNGNPTELAARFTVNGVVAQTAAGAPGNGTTSVNIVPRIRHLAAGDQISLLAFADLSGVSTSITGGYSSFLLVKRIP